MAINGLLYAGKLIHKHLICTDDSVITENIATKYAEQCQLMFDLRHPNVTVFLGICFVPKYDLPLFVSESLDGSVDDLLETIPNIPLVLKHSILEDVARGLLYLHKHKPQIVHGDLTANNVLLTTSLEAKISDYGNSGLVGIQPDKSSSSTTEFYLPPEARYRTTELHLNSSLDVFSFGHLALYTLTQVNYTCLIRTCVF